MAEIDNNNKFQSIASWQIGVDADDSVDRGYLTLDDAGLSTLKDLIDSLAVPKVTIQNDLTSFFDTRYNAKFLQDVDVTVDGITATGSPSGTATRTLALTANLGAVKQVEQLTADDATGSAVLEDADDGFGKKLVVKYPQQQELPDVSVSTDGSTISGDGTEGSPITLEPYKAFNVSWAAINSGNPGSEPWVRVSASSTGSLNEKAGLSIKKDASQGLINVSDKTFILADTDIFITAYGFANAQAAQTIEIAVSNGTNPTSQKVIAKQSVNAIYASEEAGVQCFIPKGLYWNVSYVFDAGSSGTAQLWGFKLGHYSV
jgi:hypothetical protein